MKGLPSFDTYGNYSSWNYGAHALCFEVGDLTVYFSYKTPIAFKHPLTGLVIRSNEWGPTTGKHLNAINADKSKRINGREFEARLVGILEGCQV